MLNVIFNHVLVINYYKVATFLIPFTKMCNFSILKDVCELQTNKTKTLCKCNGNQGTEEVVCWLKPGCRGSYKSDFPYSGRPLLDF